MQYVTMVTKKPYLMNGASKLEILPTMHFGKLK
jgi:hypothetical protein